MEDKHEIRTEGKFALYMMASMYLCNDFKSGLKLSSEALRVKFSGSHLFKGNCSRLHALFLE